jgi:hypothetical protein
VYRVFAHPGIEEAPNDRVVMTQSVPTIVRGVLNLQPAIYSLQSEIVLLSGDGRKVLDLHTGANDVRSLSSGVYFVRSGPSVVSREPSAVHRVVIAR